MVGVTIVGHTIAIVWMHLALSYSLALSNDLVSCMFNHVRSVIAILHCDVAPPARLKKIYYLSKWQTVVTIDISVHYLR